MGKISRKSHDLMALRSRVPSISDRNLVEFVALMQNRKKVVRLVMDSWGWIILREMLPSLGLVGDNARFKLETTRTTRLGDQFTIAVPWEESKDQQLLVYLANDHSYIDTAFRLEEVPEDPALGDLLGYPKCCVTGYKEIVSGRYWVDKITEVSDPKSLSLYANKLAYLFDGSPSLIPDYYPCSLACKSSANIGRANYLGLLAFGLKELAQTMRSKLLFPIVKINGLITQLGSCNMIGNDIFFDVNNLRFYNYGFSEAANLFSAGRISLDLNSINGNPYSVYIFKDDFSRGEH